MSACSVVPSAAKRIAAADAKAEQLGWQGKMIETGRFLLRSYYSVDMKPASFLTIYIEGDGLAWLTRTLPSSDPTPITTLVLQMAINQPEGNALYLGRPCQYTLDVDGDCRPAHWLGSRFSNEIIISMDQAVTLLKERFQADWINLVGYSGGASIATLLAARRDDIHFLVTVAGNLDHQAWSDWHRITPLTDSLNPADFIDEIRVTRQFHLLGENDKNIPPSLIRAVLSKRSEHHDAEVRVVPGYTHHCCWAEGWPDLWRNGLQAD
ncbi:alpha/beta hydrolase [Amphritea sp. 1_MG-2023]|uniref:alpha/beta hydrolase n=1 Tax=Amphritea sp. 1_MG-2023 TaxID=3062670 RepID=UPI0026E28301|nr:alpha/beta hydrolase [Amphritea sp. 1_MG-2023]MDO6562238.1 alpha/beta hydrolase [Amphritea sp. 1_MG-2023]